MLMLLVNDVPSSPSVVCQPAPCSGRHSLPSDNVVVSGPHDFLPSYHSSTLQYYYPSSHHVANFTHIPSSFQPSHTHVPPVTGFVHVPLPSAFQSHLPSLRRTPLVSPLQPFEASLRLQCKY